MFKVDKYLPAWKFINSFVLHDGFSKVFVEAYSFLIYDVFI